MDGEKAVTLSLAGTNGNLSVDPLFVSTTNFDLNLSAASPCINVGDLLGLRTTNELDIAGGPRIFALRVDMGASEFRGNRNFPPMANAGKRISAATLDSSSRPVKASNVLVREGKVGPTPM